MLAALQVSCGPYHAAAITADGRLFTWGDGLCGKLGHASGGSSLEPRPVEALAGLRVRHCPTVHVTSTLIALHMYKDGKQSIEKRNWSASPRSTLLSAR